MTGSCTAFGFGTRNLRRTWMLTVSCQYFTPRAKLLSVKGRDASAVAALGLAAAEIEGGVS